MAAELDPLEARTVAAMAGRAASDPASNPVTGVELGKAEGTMARTTKVRLDAEAPARPARK